MNQMIDLPVLGQPGRSSQRARAAAIASAGGLQAALERGLLPKQVSVSLSEGLVLGLLRQGVSKYLAIFGHGSTDLGEVLRVYTEAGVTRVFNFRNEVEMAHAGTALAWVYRETCAVVTSIGPGALQALAGSLAAASNGVGVYHIYGDESTHGEGYNMQQVPKPQRADRLAEGWTFFRDPGHVNKVLGEFDRVTLNDLNALARERLVPTNRVVLVFIPAKQAPARTSSTRVP